MQNDSSGIGSKSNIRVSHTPLFKLQIRLVNFASLNIRPIMPALRRRLALDHIAYYPFHIVYYPYDYLSSCAPGKMARESLMRSRFRVNRCYLTITKADVADVRTLYNFFLYQFSRLLCEMKQCRSCGSYIVSHFCPCSRYSVVEWLIVFLDFSVIDATEMFMFFCTLIF